MSMRALLQGVATRLIDGLALPPVPAPDLPNPLCGVQPDGRPPIDMGQGVYLAVHALGTTSLDANSLSIDFAYSVGVTITKKLRDVPRDRRGAELVLDDEILDVAERVACLIHQDDVHRAAANALIPGTAEYVAANGGSETVNGFEEPLRLQTIGAPQVTPPIWAGEDGDADPADATDMLTVLVTFTGARRCRYIGS